MYPSPSLLRRARGRTAVLGLLFVVLLAAGCSAGRTQTATSSQTARGDAPGGAAAPAASVPSGGQGAAATNAEDATLTGQASAVNAVDAPAAATGRKVVSSATLTVETTDLPAAKDKAASLTRAAGGEVYQETSSFGQRGSSVLTVKVPPDRFDTLLKDLAGLGTLAKQEIKTDDVTQQVIDLDARIRSSEASVGSVQGFVAESKNLVETAQLENELQRRIAELESLRGQRQNLEKRIDLSTIVLTLESDRGTPAAEEAKAPTPPAPPLGFGDGLDGGLAVATDILRAVAVAAGAALPFAPLVLGAILVVRWRRRRRPTNPVPPAPPAPPVPLVGA